MVVAGTTDNGKDALREVPLIKLDIIIVDARI
jgi:YesN/AraC family two-component response regulator